MDNSRPWFSCFTRLVLNAVLVGCFVASAGLSASAETGAAMIAIDRMTLGLPPAGFSFARTGRGGDGEWSVIADPTATSGRSIEQTSTESTDYRFPLAIHESLSAKNLNVEIRFKAVAGLTPRARGEQYWSHACWDCRPSWLGGSRDGDGGPQSSGPSTDQAGRAGSDPSADSLRKPPSRRGRHRRTRGGGSRVRRPSSLSRARPGQFNDLLLEWLR